MVVAWQSTPGPYINTPLPPQTLCTVFRPEPTRITLRPTNMEIIVGESIVLPCQMACDPALDVSFSWAFNGQLIDFQRDGEHFERVGGVSHPRRP